MPRPYRRVFFTGKPPATENRPLIASRDNLRTLRYLFSEKYSGAACQPPLAWEERRKEGNA
jgi:hypothetical protein